METNQPDWEKEFDKRWYLFTKDGSMSFTTCGEEVKDFIRSTIQAEKEALLEEVIKITKGKGPDLVCPINEPPFSEDYVNQWNLIKRFKVLSELGDKE